MTDRSSGKVNTVPVLLPYVFAGTYTYFPPCDEPVQCGDYVQVPFGPGKVIGVVWDNLKDAQSFPEPKRIRTITQRLPMRAMPEVTRRFIDWVAAYTITSPGHVLRMAMSVPNALYEDYSAFGIQLSRSFDFKKSIRTPARHRVYTIMADDQVRSFLNLMQEANCTSKVIHGLIDEGVLEHIPLLSSDTTAHWQKSSVTLSTAQAEVVKDLDIILKKGEYRTILLDGVTGSGKTEVYFEAVRTCLEAGHQVLILVPEIALSSLFCDRFLSHFGVKPGQWHSHLTKKQRRETWYAIATGIIRVVIGARSALFLPYPDLGLIVIDEEHDDSFKQEDGVIYHARDMGVVRASLGNIPIILVSATPAIETIVNVIHKRYRRLSLPTRHGGAHLPTIELIDLRRNTLKPHYWISIPLQEAIVKTLARGEQVMLFLNRRGYAPLTICRGCGHRFHCPECSVWLVEHKFKEILLCHYCDYTMSIPERCPHCHQHGLFMACGPGVERIDEEVTHLFPNARRTILTSDTLCHPKTIVRLFSDIHNGMVDILTGTQIMAKGYHFPKLTLVGVIDGDLGLNGGDLRAAERTYQILHQLSGRAGRDIHIGQAFIQTFSPHHAVMQALASGNRDQFLNLEIEMRRHFQMPPFTRLVAIIVAGTDPESVDRVAHDLGCHAPRDERITVWGPAPAPLALLRNHHRRRLLLKAPRTLWIQKIITDWIQSVKVPRSVRVSIDVDPYRFL